RQSKHHLPWVMPVFLIACCCNFCLLIGRLRLRAGFSGAGLCFGNRFLDLSARCMTRYCKSQPYPCAPCTRVLFRGVVELDPSAMVLKHTANNRKAKPGSLFPRSHIGL